MFFAIAVLLIQPHLVPQLSVSPNNGAFIQSTDSSASASVSSTEYTLPVAPAVTALSTIDPSARPVETANSEILPDAPVPSPMVSAAAPLAFVKPGKAMTVSVSELQAENHRKQLLWKGLVIATSSAATFDAWSTRYAITHSGARELDPLLKPFAGNASLYAAIQVGPALMDLVGKKMMYSNHTWIRRMWWVPQSAGFLSSLLCGAHNLSFK